MTIPAAHIEAIRRMRQVAAPVSSAEAENRRRRQIAGRITALQLQHLNAEPRRQRVRVVGRAAASILMGAVAFAACVALWMLRDDETSIDAPSTEFAYLSGAQKTAGATVTQADSAAERIALDQPQDLVVVESAAELRLPSRSTLKLAGGSRFRVSRETNAHDQWSETVQLDSGSVDADVPKLGDRRRLKVVTPDATVVVHGTRFSVRASSEGSVGTEVRVNQGEVIVESLQGAFVLRAGQFWQSPARAPRLAAAAPMTPQSVTSAPQGQEPSTLDQAAPRPSTKAPAMSSSVPEAAPRSDTGSEAEASSLPEANRLMQAALLAKTSGMPELALQRFDVLVQRYPGTAVAASARAERFRLLSRLGRISAARRAARQYLAAHPEGFASAEAREILGEP